MPADESCVTQLQPVENNVARAQSIMNEFYRVVAPDRFLQVSFIDGTLDVDYQNFRLASSNFAALLLEGDRDPVFYIPLTDIKGGVLLESDSQFQCRWKGNAQFFHVQLPSGDIIRDGAWAYPEAPDDVAALRTRVAFDSRYFSQSKEHKEGEE